MKPLRDVVKLHASSCHLRSLSCEQIPSDRHAAGSLYQLIALQKRNRGVDVVCHLTPQWSPTPNLAKSEAGLAERTSRFLKAELKRGNVTSEELAKRLKKP